MSEARSKQRYDLEDRTFEFAKNVRAFVRKLPKSYRNAEDVKQVLRASGSVGANYIEANEAVSKKDFLLRVKISRKEAKETRYWLRLLDTGDTQALGHERLRLVTEAEELTNIFGAIVRKTE